MGFFSWLAARFSRSQMLAPVSAVEPPALYFQHTRIGGSLTPEDVSNILRQVDTGYFYQFADLFNESRQKDCQLQAALGTRELAVASMRWQVTAASDDKADVKIADWCKEWIGNLGTSATKDDEEEPKDLRHTLSHMLSAVPFGFAYAETLAERDGGYVVPIGHVPIAHRRFVYELERGKLQFWDVFGKLPYPGIDLMAEYPGRFMLWQPRINGDVQSREGLARVLVWAALFRSWSIADWMKLAEIAWKPWRTGTYKKNASKEDIAALIRAMQNLTTLGVAWKPDDTSIDVEWAKNRGEAQHQALASFLGSEMAKAILGATLTMDQGRVGSQALGNVHNEVRHDIRDNDAAGVAACFRRTCIAPFVRMNFGRDARIPGFDLYAEKHVDLVQLSAAILNFSNAGLAIPAEWARGLAGIPTPKPDDELVGRVETATDAQLAAFLAEARRRGILPQNDAARAAA